MLDPDTIGELTNAIAGFDADVHGATGADALNVLARLDAHSTYIRLEHRPLHDELCSILRFNRRQLEKTRKPAVRWNAFGSRRKAHHLAVQPHGVMPQYLTKLDEEPDGFTPRHAETMPRHSEPFHQIFPPGTTSDLPSFCAWVIRDVSRLAAACGCPPSPTAYPHPATGATAW